jgi:hypothetical protein
MARPKSTTDVRSKMNGFYLTEDDSIALTEFAKRAGFRSTSQLVTALIERLLIGGFSPCVFMKLGLQLRSYIDKNGEPYEGGLYFGIRPLPALPDSRISPAQWKKELPSITEGVLQTSTPENTKP